MTIQELKDLKDQAEAQIAIVAMAAVKKLQEETGLLVNDVSIELVRTEILAEKPRSHVGRVRISLVFA